MFKLPNLTQIEFSLSIRQGDTMYALYGEQHQAIVKYKYHTAERDHNFGGKVSYLCIALQLMYLMRNGMTARLHFGLLNWGLNGCNAKSYAAVGTGFSGICLLAISFLDCSAELSNFITIQYQ